MYTLYGHEGSTTAANFSPNGDYFISGGNDSVVLCWESNMNPVKTEILDIKAKIETEVFVTEKEKVDKLPSTRGTKMGKSAKKVSIVQLFNLYQINQSKLTQQQSQSSILDNSIEDKTQVGDEHLLPSQKVIKGMTYRKLKPEVKMTLEKVVYQLELVAKTLQLME